MTYFFNVLETIILILLMTFMYFALSGFDQWPSGFQMTTGIAWMALFLAVTAKNRKID